MNKELIYIIIPTYNEIDSLPHLIRELIDVIKKNRLFARILVIDDSSPDGTIIEAQKFEKLSPSIVQVFDRKKKLGLGSALRFGYSKALQEKADYVIQLDADLSHNPRSIPRFLNNIKNYDLVLGSRYISGSKIINWNFFRKIISLAGIYYAKILLNLPFHDLTTGFRCLRANCLRTVAIDTINTDGYGFQIEIVDRFYAKGLKIKEMPIEFTERRAGQSKFSKKIALEAFLQVLKLRRQGKKQKK